MLRALRDKGWTCTGYREPGQASNRVDNPIRERYKWRFLCPVQSSRTVHAGPVVPMSEVRKDAEAEYCRFCGARDCKYLGRTRTYLRWPADVDREEGVYHFAICGAWAFADRDNTEQATPLFHEADRDYLRTCDCCGAVGCQSSSTRRPTEDSYRLRSVIAWSVEIVGFNGTVGTCLKCSPVLPIGCVKRSERSYNDAAIRLAKPQFDSASTTTVESAPKESRQEQLETRCG